MAQIARRKWSELQTEAILAAGGHAYTGFSTRMSYWLTEAYYEICATYHQYALDADSLIALPDGTSQLELPVDCYIVVSVGVVDGSNRPLKFLRSEHFRLQGGTLRGNPGDLLSFSRFKNAIYFNAPSKPGTRIRLYYYRFPIAPDFAGTATEPPSVPETDWLWDTQIVDAGVAKAQRRIWRPDLGQFNTQSLKEWLDAQAQAQTKEEPTGAQPDRPLPNVALGGKQT